MATYNEIATFTVDGDPTDTNNFSGDGLATGDKCIIQPTNPSINIASGGANQGAIVLDEFTVPDTYLGTIGASGQEWQIDAAEAWFYNGGPACYMDMAITDAYVKLKAGNMGANALVLNVTNAHTIGSMHAQRGRIKLGGNCTCTTLNMVPLIGSDLIVVSDGCTFTNVYLRDGQLNWDTSAGTPAVHQYGGLLIHDQSTITTINLYGGIYQLKRGTFGTLNMRGGTLDLTQTTGTVTGTTVNYWAGDIIHRDRPNWAGSVTINWKVEYKDHRAGDSTTWA